MSNKNISIFSIVFLVAVSLAVTAQEGIEADLLQKVESDYRAMLEMTPKQREVFFKQNVSGLSKADRRAYQQAYKALAPNLPEMPSAKNEKQPGRVVPNTGGSGRVPGTNITYDAGTGTGVMVGLNSQMLGNLFDQGANAAGTAIESVETTGTITQITFDMLAVGGTGAFFSVFSNIMGTSANGITSVLRTGLAPGLNTLGTSVMYSNGPFLAGIWQFGSDNLAVSSGSVNGQGFHAISINDIAGTMYNSAVTSGGMGLNAIFRVSGNVLQESVPVELMDFTIED